MPDNSHINTRADIMVIPIVAVLGEITIPVVVLQFVLGYHCRHFRRIREKKQIGQLVAKAIQHLSRCQYDEWLDTRYESFCATHHRQLDSQNFVYV